jgi:small neutral amino acid transporter SnatA (MarC family)
MKTTFLIIFFIAMFLYIGDTSIKFNPFKIEIQKPYMAVGWFLLIISVACFTIQGEKTGFKKGCDETVKIVKDVFSESNSDAAN